MADFQYLVLNSIGNLAEEFRICDSKDLKSSIIDLLDGGSLFSEIEVYKIFKTKIELDIKIIEEGDSNG